MKVALNGKWTLDLPEHRAARPEWATGWERERLDSMHQWLTAGDVVFDIGAEEGDMSALYAAWGCDVFLVEPNPRVWPCTRASFEMNGLTPLGFYVGMCSDTASGANDAEYGLGGWPRAAYGPVVPDHGQHQIGANDDPTTTIDDLVERTGMVPTAITMDIEGGELHALRGAAHTLLTYAPLVWCSVHLEFMADIHGEPVGAHLWQFMADHGYSYEMIAYDHELHILWTSP